MLLETEVCHSPSNLATSLLSRLNLAKKGALYSIALSFRVSEFFTEPTNPNPLLALALALALVLAPFTALALS